jgi:hypothetical protein
VVKKPQRRRPRPDLGCRAIGWMEVLEYFQQRRFQMKDIDTEKKL